MPQFDKVFANFHEARYGVSVTNGTAALEVCLRALNIGCGDEVIVPPYTFVATASSVLSVSATPVFVDIEPHSLNLDPSLIQVDDAAYQSHHTGAYRGLSGGHGWR